MAIQEGGQVAVLHGTSSGNIPESLKTDNDGAISVFNLKFTKINLGLIIGFRLKTHISYPLTLLF